MGVNMAQKIVAIIQARLGSSRLPLKSLLSLNGAPIIDWVTDRVAKAAKIDEMIVAIPDTPLDEALAVHLSSRGTPWISGPENDVLGRFVKAAVATQADLVIRICADNPMIWWEALDRLVEFYQIGGLDYAYNHVPLGNLWPDGLGGEIISRQMLESMNSMATQSSQREHCLNYIRDNAEKFRIGTFDPKEPWLRRPDLKLDVDSAEDFRRLALLPLHKDMSAREIIAACQ